MALFKNGSFIDDVWGFAGDAVLPDGPVAVSKARLLAEKGGLITRSTPLGLVLTSADDLAGLEEVLENLDLVVIDFPKYTDGRPYSLARKLRDQLGYAGELRARGDVLHDQLLAMLRSGFDALEISHPGTIAALKAGEVIGVRHHYQLAANSFAETVAGTRPWQRRSLQLGAVT